MAEQIRALIVILFLATSFFYFVRSSFEPMLQPGQFARWRNCWLAVTTVAFMSGNFWIFIAVSALIIKYASKLEDNRYGLHQILLISVPLISARIPGLFDITIARLLAIMLIFPAIFNAKMRNNNPKLGSTLPDKIMLGFVILGTLLYMRGLTVTDSMRNGLYLFFDMFLPYYGASRLVKDFAQLKAIMIAFLMGTMVIALIGAFEYSSGWLLYNYLPTAMKADFSFGGYLARGDNLRASASTGHSLALGFVMMVTLGFYLFIAPSIKSKFLRYAGFAVIAAGSYGALARGSWVGIAIIILVFFACSPNKFRRLSQLSVAVIIIILTLPSIPGGKKVINLLPFVGNTDQYNVDYRERLLEKSMLIIEREPLFGVFNATVEPEMADMVTGEGIVDIVNTYLGYALGFGLVGLGLFLWFFIYVLFKLIKTMFKIKDKRSEEYLCSRALLATMVAILVNIFSVSSIGVIDTLYCSMGGLILSYVRIMNRTIQEKKLTKAIKV